jgi:hypothetical protein
MHLKYVLDTEPERREELHHYLDKAEGEAAGGGSGDVTFRRSSNPFACCSAAARTSSMRACRSSSSCASARINEYVHRLTVAGMGDRRDRLGPLMAQFLDPPRAAGTTGPNPTTPLEV